MEIKRFFRIFFVAATALAAAGCSDDPDPTTEFVLRDIVRYESSDNGTTVFTLMSPEIDADARVVLTARRSMPDDFKPGDRLMISYVPASGEAYVSGEVEVRGMAAIANIAMKSCPDKEIAGWNAEPVYMLSLWRSGDFLNMRALMRYSSKSRRFGLLLPESEKDREWPDVYVAHELADDVPAFDREYYISFDISKLTANEAVKGFNLHINNSNLKETQFSFRLRD